MNYQVITLSREEQTAVVTINRPEALNALNAQVINELEAVFQEIASDDSIRGVILTGSGPKAFVAGADIAGIAALETAEQAESLSLRGQTVFAGIESFAKPVIAAVNGFALGGGCELAMSCHLRVASENAKFGQPEVNLGIIAGYGGTQRLTYLVGKTKAMELLLTADMISAADALSLGLVNAVGPADQLMAKCKEILAKCYTKSPLALAKTIDAVNAALQPQRNGFQVEAQEFGKVCISADGREGTKAFLEKRKPVFTGK